MTQKGRQLIEQADVVAGFGTVIEFVKPLISQKSRVVTMGYKDQVEQLQAVASLHGEE